MYFRLTSLDTSVVLELVSGGTLALQLSVGHGYSRGAVWANAGVPVSRLRQTQQAAWLVGTGVMAWWKTVQDISLIIVKCSFTVLILQTVLFAGILLPAISVPHLCSSLYRRS